MRRRITAGAALVCFAAGLLVLFASMLSNVLAAIAFAALLLLGAWFSWTGLVHDGTVRIVSWTVAVLLGVGAIACMIASRTWVAGLAAIVLLAAAVALSWRVFSTRTALPPGAPVNRPFMIYNPKSGDGVAERVGLAEEAKRRGIEPLCLDAAHPIDELIDQAIAGGADALMAAGGDGTQAAVAAAAAKHGLPFACVPAGTRNHFALDLGVDRADVVGALDAFADGGERLVDLAEVNGQVFVNNVSIGAYAEAVHDRSYRGAKLRTLLKVIPAAFSTNTASTTPTATADIAWKGPQGRRQTAAALILVSNNPYRVGARIGAGTRPALDTGELGIITLASRDGESQRPSLVSTWSVDEFVVDAEDSATVPVGIDGEAAELSTPLVFRSTSAALRARVARAHPGSSPSAGQPKGLVDALRQLLVAAVRG